MPINTGNIVISGITDDTSASGVNNTDFYTKDTSLKVTVTYERTGESWTQTTNNNTIYLYYRAETGPWQQVPGGYYVASNGSGTHDFTLPNLGEGVYTLAVARGDSLNTKLDWTPLTIDTSASVSIGSVIDNVPAAFGVSDGGWTNDQTLALTGSVEAGSTVKVYGGASGTTFLGNATVSGGTWSFDTVNLSEGKHTLKVEATDKAGNTATDTHVVYVDVTAPSLSYSIDDNVGVVKGALADNSTTDDRKPTFSGTAEASQANGGTVRVYLMEGNTELGSAIVGADGSWSITPTNNLSNNVHNLTVKVVDAAGNVTTSELSLDVNDGAHNRQATITSGGNDDVGLYTGAITDGTVSDDRDIVLSGTVANAQAGDWVRVYDGSTYVGMSTIGANGGFSVAASGLSSGDHDFQAFVVNKYGVESNNPGNNFDYTVDITAPGNTVTLISIEVDDGNVVVHGSVDGNGYNRQGGGGGPVSDGNNNGTVTLALYDGDTFVQSGTLNFGAGNGESADEWLWGPWSNFSNGLHNLSVRAIDAVGNLGAKSNVLTADVVKNEAPTDISLSKTSVAENSAEGVVVGKLGFTDAGDSSNHVYSIVAGTGQGKFVIDSATGELKVAANAGLNYEAKSSYTLTLRVTDKNGTGLSHDEEFTISVTDVNDVAPEIDSGASAADYVEGTSVTVYTATRVDNDGTLSNRAIVWTLKDGLNDDRALFEINATTGEVTFVTSPDYDSSAAIAKGNTYTFTVVANNPGVGGSQSDEQVVTVHVTDVNDNKPVFDSGTSASFAENGHGAVYTIVTHDNDGTLANTGVSYTLTGDDAALFDIDASTGDVTFKSGNTPNFEKPGDADKDHVYHFNVVATNAGTGDTTLTETQHVAITITEVNEVQTDILLDGSTSIDEDLSVGATIGQLSSVDEDTDEHFTYSVVGGSGASLVGIGTGLDSDKLVLTSALDYESAVKSFDVKVRSTDTRADGALSLEKTFNFTVVDVNDNGPVIGDGSTTASYAIDENQKTVVTFLADDKDGTSPNNTISWSLSGTDAGKFTITGGVLALINKADYESKTQYSVTVTATDGGTPAKHQSVAVTVDVNDLNDNAPVIGGAASRTFEINENDPATLTKVFEFSASDNDGTAPNNTIKWSLTGNDASLFKITDGVLALKDPANYEGKSQYKVTVVATDQGNPAKSDSVSVTVNVKDINEQPTADASVEVSYAENILGFGAFGQVIADIHPQDPDKQSGIGGALADLLNNFEDLSYTITAGNDAGLFMVSGGKVYLNPLKSLDFEKQPVHTLTIVTRDGGGMETTSTVKINVGDIDEAPVFTDGFLNFIKTISVNEGDVDVSMPAVVAVDPDAGDAAVVYSIVTGALSPDASKFTIDPATGALKLVNPADYEAKQVFTVQIKATDGNNPSLYAIQQVIITVADKNEAPTTADQAFSVTENLVDGGLVGKVIGTDPDKQTGVAAVLDLLNNFENLTYAFAEGGNAGGLFTIDATTGDIRLVGALDAETQTQYELKVVTTDGAGASKESTVTVTVEDVNDKAPVITSEATADPFVEHGTGQVYKVTSTDGDLTEGNRAVTYALEGGDSTLFNINAETGVVTFKDAPDFENPGGLAGDNTYSFTVKAINTAGGVTLTDSKTVSVTVTDANDKAPVITSGALATPFAERGTGVVYTVTSTDADGTADNRTVTYAIEGDDAHLFNIDPVTGKVTFKDAPDFDAPLDVGADNAYNFIVKAINTAGGVTLTDAKAVTVNVVDVNEFAPVFTSGTTADAFAENGTGVVYTAVTTDDDTYQSTSYALAGDDANLFNIDATTGEVTFKVAPDFENPVDVNANNIYNFIVIATNATAGGTQTASQNVVLTVTDVNEAAPVFTSSNAVTVAEGNGGVIYTATTTDADSTKIVSYALTGVDAGLFTINAATGAVSFRNAPNFEAPADAGANNVYNFEVVATNTTSGSTQTTSQAMTVTVTDIDETNLVITSPGGPINDSTPRVVGGANATLAGQTVTLFEGARELGTATVQADGSWSMDAANLGNDGIHNLIARLGGQSSNVVAFNLDTVAPTVAITGVTGPGLTATVAGTAGAGEVGRAVVILEGSTVLGSGVVAADGTFSFSVTMPASGPHNLVASVTDAAGNDGVSTPVTYNAAPTPSQGQADADNIVTAYQNIMDRPSIATKDTTFMLDLVEKMGSGAMSYQQALAKVIDLADGTTSVATLSYQFFTGTVPTKAGLDYLILDPGTNPNNLNSAYYQNFNVENRYINFAVNLGHEGEGKAAFQTNYGSLSLFDATKKAYAEIFGSGAATDTKIHAILDETVAFNGQNGARSAYFAAYGHDDLGTKAAMVGWLLAEAAKADVGTYALSNEAFLADLSDGAPYNVNIIGVYGTSSMALV